MKSNHFKSYIDFTAPEKKNRKWGNKSSVFSLSFYCCIIKDSAEKKQTQQSHSDQGQLSSITHKEGKKTKTVSLYFTLPFFSSIQPNTHKAEEETYYLAIFIASLFFLQVAIMPSWPFSFHFNGLLFNSYFNDYCCPKEKRAKNEQGTFP